MFLSLIGVVLNLSFIFISGVAGIPRLGRLCGDIYICKQGVIGETIRPIGGLELVLALDEAHRQVE